MLAGAKKRKADFTDVVMFVAIASKHLRMIILLVTLALTAGLIFYIFSRPVYSSKSIIKFAAIGTQTPDDKTIGGDRFNPDRWLGEFEAEHIVRKTEAALGNPRTGPGRRDKIKLVRAGFDTEGNIELSVFSYDHTWVLLFPPKMVEIYEKYELEKMANQNSAEIAKLNSQLELYMKAFTAQETKRAQALGGYDAETLAARILELQTVPKEIEFLRSKLKSYEEIRLKLQNNLKLSDSERLSLLSGFNDEVGDVGAFIEIDDKTKQSLSPAARPANGTVIVPPSFQRASIGDWENLERQKLSLERTIKEQSLIYRPGHDKMKQLFKQREGIEKALKEELNRALARFEIIGLKMHKRYQSLDVLHPQYRVSKEQYDKYLLEKSLLDKSDIDYLAFITTINRRKAELVLASSNQRVQIKFDRTEPKSYDIPVSPNRLNVTLMFLGIGIALGLGVPFLLEFMDQTVTNVEKMEEATNIRGLGLIPDFEDTVAEAYPLIFSDGVANPDLIENFRVVRTNLLSSAATSKFPQVIMITSTSPKEGKTVVASNLAMSFAQMGEKTLILDANLRRGIQHHLFGSRSSPGVSNVLVEKYDVADACRPTTMENLHILPSGDQLEGDIELLGSPQFAQMIEQLRKRYQRIIVDSPPVLGLAETSVMQPAMDGVVLVIWSGQTPTRAVRTAMEILEANHANFYGFVLNRLDLMATMNRFHYYYYTNHYYNRYQSLTRQQGS
ncbi:MAG: polysaccharide biosynthesis tyrosine autokinase [Verrucomicrobia bacterium]|nr:polysaccharide biosynthesis tyrosine autokinase [Verrucomicrobiota bacterium]